jgi:DNA-binding response OmpR family regulator
MFAEHGFDDFIAKPIDIRQLNAVLNRFVRDRHPEEALLYPAGSIDSSIMNHTITNHTVIDHVGTNQTNESNDKSNEGSN